MIICLVLEISWGLWAGNVHFKNNYDFTCIVLDNFYTFAA